jgi:hypothetical protein
LEACTLIESLVGVPPIHVVKTEVTLWRVSQHRKQKFSYEDKQEQAKIWSTRCKIMSERD